MKQVEAIQKKIFTLTDLVRQIAAWRVKGYQVAFTNGCFDILHEGHIFSLEKAASEAQILVVGVNSDASVQKLKGADRPINKEKSRCLLLASLAVVDAVIVFEEDTPLELIQSIQPDVLVKGGDYTIEQIVGAKEVQSWGGRVVINPIVEGFSTTGIIQKIKGSYS